LGSARPGWRPAYDDPNMTADELAAAGRALYGERWQTSLAMDLHVADRTMRRWLVSETPIPNGIERELREVLVKRVKEIGGMIGYSVNPSDRSVFHYPTNAFFRYDDAGNLTLVHPGVATGDDVALVTEGAKEALRQERERDPRIKLTWLDAAGRGDSSMEIEEEYKGCVITYPRIRRDTSGWTVNLSSNNRHLFTQLGGCVVIKNHVSLEGAIAEAKRRVDELA
jgi:hypothetical protein